MQGEELKRNILFVMQNGCASAVGGSVIISFDIANLLYKNDYNVTCCYYSKDKNKKPEYLHNSIDLINLQNDFDDFSAGVNNLVEKTKPDLIIFVFPGLYFRARLDDKFSSIPRILMFHSRPDFYFAEGLDEKEFEKIYKSTTSQILFESFYALLPDFIKKQNVVCIPNYYRCHELRRNFSAEHKKIVYLSRVDACKGVDFLIKSFAKVAKKYPEWKIDIWGQSQPAYYINALRRLARIHKVDKQIIFKGITKEPLETLTNYDFCVFPSIFEGFGVGLVEAQSVGLPAIGRKACSGVNELIIDGKNGFLSDENYDDFAAKIEELINNQELRTQLGLYALENAKQYDKTRTDAMWLNAVNKILENGKEDNVLKNEKTKYGLYPIDKIMDKYYYGGYTPSQKLFSIKNQLCGGKKAKILYILGLRFKISTK